MGAIEIIIRILDGFRLILIAGLQRGVVGGRPRCALRARSSSISSAIPTNVYLIAVGELCYRFTCLFCDERTFKCIVHCTGMLLSYRILFVFSVSAALAACRRSRADPESRWGQVWGLGTEVLPVVFGGKRLLTVDTKRAKKLRCQLFVTVHRFQCHLSWGKHNTINWRLVGPLPLNPPLTTFLSSLVYMT